MKGETENSDETLREEKRKKLKSEEVASLGVSDGYV